MYSHVRETGNANALASDFDQEKPVQGASV